VVCGTHLEYEVDGERAVADWLPSHAESPEVVSETQDAMVLAIPTRPRPLIFRRPP